MISAFEYASGNVQKMFAANANNLYEVTFFGDADPGQGGAVVGQLLRQPIGERLRRLHDRAQRPGRLPAAL